MNQSKKIFVICSLFSLFATASLADHSHEYIKATEAYNAGDYQTALHLWGEEAKRGSQDAQEMLGAIHATGKGTKQDYVEAARWYLKAAEQGSGNSQYSLGGMYYEGRGVKKSLERAYAWWLVSAAGGNEGAKVKQSMVLNEMTPDQIEKTKQLAFEILQKLAR